MKGELRDAGRGKPNVTDTQQGGPCLVQVFRLQGECWVIWRVCFSTLIAYITVFKRPAHLDDSFQACLTMSQCAERFHIVHFCIRVCHTLKGPQSLGKKLIAQLRIAEVCFLSIFTVATCPCWTHAHSCTRFTAMTWWTWIEMDRNGGLITRPKDVIDVTANPRVVWCSLLRKFFKWNTAVLRRFCWDWLHVDGSLALLSLATVSYINSFE
jgi:hypothetical protein